MSTQTNNNQTINLDELRERLAHKKGQHYWRSLEELADTEEFQQFVQNEFPHGLPDWGNPVSRRTFLKLMGASMALAGLAACGPLQPVEKIVPHVEQPPEESPGNALFFASTMTLGGYATGLLVESHEGRPTKIEGNPNHPASRGATDLFAQASILTMYDPDRSQKVRNGDNDSTWEAFLDAVVPQMSRGNVRILTETITSPTLISQLETLQDTFSSVKWYQYDPLGRDNVRAGAKAAFGEHVEPRYQFQKATTILSLDADFVMNGPGNLVYAREFIDGRRVRADQTEMNRLYVVESMPSATGSMADHRLPLRACEMEDFARMVASRLGIKVGDVHDVAPTEWVDALVEDLEAHKGASLVVAGEEQPASVHALVHAINAKLDNIGETVVFTEPVASPASQLEGLRKLVEEMQEGKVDTLIIIEGNPVFTAPADLDFAGALANVQERVHLSLFDDETSEQCTWHIPATHFLETWGDARAYDGTASIIQPLIAPLYDGKSAYELLAALMGDTEVTGYDIVKAYWSDRLPNRPLAWEQALKDGVIPDTAFSPKSVSLATQKFSRMSEPSDDLEIVFRADPSIRDGSFANNGWLQETPKPVTKITWDNAVHIAPATAQRLRITNGDVVRLSGNGAGPVEGAVWITPGQANDTIVVNLGYGRTRAGRVGNDTGFNAYRLRTTETFWSGHGVTMARTGQQYRLASTAYHHSIDLTNPNLQKLTDERIPTIVRVGTIEQFREDPEFAHHIGHGHGGEGEVPSLYPKLETTWGEGAWVDDEGRWKGARWGMVVDLNACTGCNACLVACQAENNIPIVGREEVIVGREMHWIRIDRYYEGGLDNPQMHNQPLGCVHCEVAPCEPVCPVAATAHSLEGLNEMIYNRCVGTRYCANNCPYKVRRFNYYQYTDLETESLKLMRNPNVTARNRGVMEKCTYCVQRINLTRIALKRDTGQSGFVKYEDGSVVPACAQACPTQAITFGDIADEESRVAKLKHEPHNYDLLGDLGVVPRTSYLARVRNPNPKIEPPVEDHGHGNGHSSSHEGEE